jgi:glycosyltransferase involved in cell wall biosynthesis
LNLFWWIAGALLAVVWVDRARDARAMEQVPDLAGPEWDRDFSATNSSELSSIDVVVPARNEEQHISATVTSLLAQDYPAYHVIAVDDRSTDSTGEIIDSIRSGLTEEARERLRVLHITELPSGWLGKTHAMWTAAQQGTSDWLLFTDADVTFRHDALRRAILFAEQSGADHVVVFPSIPAKSVGGRMMLAFFQLLFVFMHRPWKVSDPNSRDSIGFGAFNLIRRSAYEKVGTWKALRLAVVEDMKLGELLKRNGMASYCAFGQEFLTNYWAETGRDVVRNLTKNVFAVMDYRPALAIAACVALLFLNLSPFVGLALAPGYARLPFALAAAGIVGLYLGMARCSEPSAIYFFLHPVATVLFVYIMLRSMGHVIRHGGIVWRGTKYSLEELRRDTVESN